MRRYKNQWQIKNKQSKKIKKLSISNCKKFKR